MLVAGCHAVMIPRLCVARQSTLIRMLFLLEQLYNVAAAMEDADDAKNVSVLTVKNKVVMEPARYPDETEPEFEIPVNCSEPGRVRYECDRAPQFLNELESDIWMYESEVPNNLSDVAVGFFSGPD